MINLTKRLRLIYLAILFINFQKLHFIIGLVSFFLLLNFNAAYSQDNNTAMNSIIEKAIENKLYESHVWKSLLEMNDNKLNIKDPNFILSIDNFSLKNELIMTIKSFFEEHNDIINNPICRFPARYYWLKNELVLSDSIFPKINCLNFEEYERLVSAQKFDLIFVSEDALHPSSMVGHVFLKLSGYNHNANYVKNAVSFYTVIEPRDTPLLIFKSTITGMKGYFSLLPYNEQIKRYLEVENRNVWEYELNLTEEDKLLIYYHIWELKDLQIKYLYTGYNCATVIYNLLSLSSVNLSKNNNRLWITPKDVIKDAYQNGMIINAKLIPSDEWMIRMLSDVLDDESKFNIYTSISSKSINNIMLNKDSTKASYEINLIRSYTNYLHKNGKIDANEMNDTADVIRLLEDNNHLDNTNTINISQYKSPLNTFDDSQLGLGYKRITGINYIKIFFLPASNTLYDDNREYFNETSLRLGETSLLINKNTIKLESFQLYAVKSLLPWNVFVNGTSYEFRMGAENHFNNELHDHLALNLSGGIGLTKELSSDLNTYILIGGGFGYGESNLYLYGSPEVGATIYELMNMKTIFSYKFLYNQLKSNNYYHQLAITQALFWNKDLKLNTSLTHLLGERQSNNLYELVLHFYY